MLLSVSVRLGRAVVSMKTDLNLSSLPAFGTLSSSRTAVVVVLVAVIVVVVVVAVVVVGARRS